MWLIAAELIMAERLPGLSKSDVQGVWESARAGEEWYHGDYSARTSWKQ